MQPRIDPVLLAARDRGVQVHPVLVRLAADVPLTTNVPGLTVDFQLASVRTLVGTLSLSALDAALATPGILEIEADSSAAIS